MLLNQYVAAHHHGLDKLCVCNCPMLLSDMSAIDWLKGTVPVHVIRVQKNIIVAAWFSPVLSSPSAGARAQCFEEEL